MTRRFPRDTLHAVTSSDRPSGLARKVTAPREGSESARASPAGSMDRHSTSDRITAWRWRWVLGRGSAHILALIRRRWAVTGTGTGMHRQAVRLAAAAPQDSRGGLSTTGDGRTSSTGSTGSTGRCGTGESEVLSRSGPDGPFVPRVGVTPSPHRSAWPQPLLVALALSGGIVLAYTLSPGIPGFLGAHAGLIGHLFALLSGICPQRPSHSYTLGGIQLPLEARMLGIVEGFTVGVLELATAGRTCSRRWPHASAALALGVGFMAMVVDGGNALLFDLADLGLPHLYTPDLRLRLGTGLLAGVAMAFALVPALGQLDAADPEASVSDRSGQLPRWSHPSRRPGLRDVGCALLAGGTLTLLTASGWQVLLDPMALVAAYGTVLAFGLINRTAIGAFLSAGMSRRLEDREWLLGIAALTWAVVELILLAFLRATVVPR